MFEHIRYEVEDDIATIRFDRAEKLNAYLPAMGEEAVAAFARAREDAGVRAVILTGTGRAFCAGVDLEHFERHMRGELDDDGPELGQETFVRSFPLELAEYPKPVIAAINGSAHGVGVTMTLGCDVRYAVRGAKLGLNFARLGVLPGLGSTHHLPRLVGLSKSLELVLSGATLTAEEAHALGLVQGLCDDPDQLEAQTRAIARRMAEIRPEVLAAAKSALRGGAEASLSEAMAGERELSDQLAQSGGGRSVRDEKAASGQGEKR